MRLLLQLLTLLGAQIQFSACFVLWSPSTTPSRVRQRVCLFEQADESQWRTIKRCGTVDGVISILQEESDISRSDPNMCAAALCRLTDLWSSQNISDADKAISQKNISILIKEIDQALKNDSASFKLRALVNVLFALPKHKDKHDTIHLANRICHVMEEYEDDLVQSLRPFHLMECLSSLSVLELHYPTLVGRICQRLEKGDALATFDAQQLAAGLKALAILEYTDENTSAVQRAFARRWRKQKIRQTATTSDICQALFSARRMMQYTTDKSLEDEITTMIYTLFRELASPLPNNKTRAMTAGQVAEVIMTASAIQVNVTNPIFNHIMETLNQDYTMKRATISDVSRILSSMKRLSLSMYPLAVQGLGVKLLYLVQQEPVEPGEVMNLLRSALALHQRDAQVMKPYEKAVCFLILERTAGNSSFFLQQCGDIELSSLVRFLSLIRCSNEDALVTLAERILEPDMAESCSPKAASQILTYYTSLIDSSAEELNKLQSHLSELFHELGTHLLSAQLSPAETSASMQAYAKASYVQDMGIFDHLANHLAAILDTCSVRQVTQGLWSCGKLVGFESEHGGVDGFGSPYLEAARKYAEYLASITPEMNAKDTSQTLWAIGRLGIDNEKVVSLFADRARQLIPECNSQEVATILWGLARVAYDNRELVSELTNRILVLKASSQEAATVLYSLGRMEIQDENVFSAMSAVMMTQVETASAQSIANALWAFRTVELHPPRQLMDSWVTQKLGLEGVTIGQVDL